MIQKLTKLNLEKSVLEEVCENNLKTPGLFLGQSENRCYLGVFPNNATETDEEFRNHWVLGSKFLN